MPQNLVMEKPDSSLIKQALCWLLVILACLSARAQKLPNKQENSVTEPATVKIDGRVTEWDNKFQAYNSATQVYYTMANDSHTLYLTVQATDPLIVTRITSSGVTLSITKAGNKTAKDAISVTYPIVEHSPYFGIANKKIIASITTPEAADSLMKKNNALLERSCRSIKVKGIPGLDTLISVYNTDGIKAAGAFDIKRAYTFELAIDLNLLKDIVKSGDKLTYHLVVNGMRSMGAVSAISVTPGHEAMMEAFVAKVNEMGAQQSAPTDFWGEYRLVK